MPFMNWHKKIGLFIQLLDHLGARNRILLGRKTVDTLQSPKLAQKDSPVVLK